MAASLPTAPGYDKIERHDQKIRSSGDDRGNGRRCPTAAGAGTGERPLEAVRRALVLLQDFAR